MREESSEKREREGVHREIDCGARARGEELQKILMDLKEMW